MKIEPTYTSVGSLFEYRPMFFIPKYQRAYAWSSESVEDFIKDLKNCFNRRKSNSPVNHFFGGVLCVRYSVGGTVNQHEYEIIDGQQRIATFTILVSCLIKIYEDLKKQAEKSGSSDNKIILDSRIKLISERFIEFSQEVQRKINSVEVLRLSIVDHPFYKELIRGRKSSVLRDSHNRILSAYTALDKAVRDIIDSSTLEGKMDNVEIIQNIIDIDFTILYMVTDSKEDAFRLFQVINDRGTNLTVGDLLKAKTLEIVEGFNQYQDKVEVLWNNILADPPSDTEKYLNWIYESYQGNRARQDSLFDLFLDKFFPQHKNHKTENFKEDEVIEVHTKLNNIHDDIKSCRLLVEGQWLYEVKQPIMSWDRTRLNLLLKELDHELSVPLFLAASKLDHKRFAEIVQILEKVFFRYKIICNQHVTPLKTIYYQELLEIRQNPDSYNASSLRQKLRRLIDDKAPERVFKTNLETLEYRDSGGSNKPLKYFLMAVEYYYQWYKNGAVGNPECVDKSRVYDFAGTSIEHIYPQNAEKSFLDSNLEPLKNTLGNLTILDPAQNTYGGNDTFVQKIPLYQASSMLLNRDIAVQTNWTQQEINNHKNLLVDVAIKIFYP
ncbi:DUF262 domain-containing protein [Nostoc sp. FACHB-892]|uniref:DUF262 domain-containing protein n=1 Tax=Nostoc sp. FACHB-892 TaxID=2692843 RepID=UPI001686FA48|nr:DUF262 domain-containing protein [Nostoc sp. FACHB-892]MBD2730835.1 DUF262 domain-containing protein [Nostoc sp. FACHB-892]